MSWIFNEAAWRQASAQVLLFLPQVAMAMLLLAVFWLLGVWVARLIRRLGRTRKLSADAMAVLALAAKLVLQVTGVITALGTLGVNVTALVAGLGLTGFALGFALKDIISNILAGLIILMYKPFHHADRIVVQTSTVPWLEGIVSQIDLRYTTLELPDRRILIPNANLLTNAIVVYNSPTPPVAAAKSN
jgi:small conductance mechanosensitive channel